MTSAQSHPTVTAKSPRISAPMTDSEFDSDKDSSSDEDDDLFDEESVFEDEKRLYEIIAEMKSRMQSDLVSAGHQVAMGRAASYFSNAAAISSKMNGLDLYRLVCDVEKNYEERKYIIYNVRPGVKSRPPRK